MRKTNVTMEPFKLPKRKIYTDEEIGDHPDARINQYECDEGHIITTKDLDTGTTPMTMDCPFCGKTTHSKFYKVPQNLEYTHVFYRPVKINGASKLLKEELDKGLLICMALEQCQRRKRFDELSAKRKKFSGSKSVKLKSRGR